MTDLGPTDALRAMWAEGYAAAALLDSMAAAAIKRVAHAELIAATITPTAVISPASAAAVGLTIGAATIGPLGLAVVAAQFSATATAARHALALLDQTDQLLRGDLLAALGGVDDVATYLVRAGAPALQRSAEAIAGAEGPPRVTRGTTVDQSASAPQRFSDLLRQLSAINDLPDGTIGVQRLQGADGITRFVVSLPGTDGFDRDAVRNWSANASIRLNQTTTYERGIRAVLEAAGVRPEDPVLLVGHSQGGMVAAQIARDPGALTVAQVVTAGSPIGDRPPPSSTGLIALENAGDLVPSIDGGALRETALHHTVRFSDGIDGPISAHRLEHYIRGAETAEGSEHRALLAGVEPFLGATAAESTTWVISRADP